jgi:hypothetical protein
MEIETRTGLTIYKNIMAEQKHLRHWVIVILVITHQLISFIWYSPWLFGFKWINASGFRFSNSPPVTSIAFYTPFIFSIIASVLLCYAIAFLYARFEIETAFEGIKWGFVIWFVFLFINLLTHHQFAQRPVALTLIDGGRDCLIFLLTGLVVSTLVFRKNQ